MKIIVLDGYALNPGDISWEGLEQIGELTVYDRTPNEEIVSRIGDSEIVFSNKTPFTKETIEACKNLKFIGLLSTGYNIVDLEAAKSAGITVCNIPGYSTNAVAQFTFALILELCHHVFEHSTSVKEGQWTACKDFCYWNYPLMELAGKTIGIIGFGKIGQAVGKIANAFGMNVLAFANHPNPSLENDNCHYADLDTIFTKSDIISLHCPLFDSTRGLICKENIAKMKDGAMIINTARGPIIVEEDLKSALESGKLSGAAVDVASVEPLPADSPLLSAPNMIITPHIAWAATETRARLMGIAVENLKAYLAGTPINTVC